VVRLSGTNAKEGLALLKETGLTTVSTMSEAARKAIELSQQKLKSDHDEYSCK